MPPDRDLVTKWWSEAWTEGLWAAAWSKSLDGLTPQVDRNSLFQRRGRAPDKSAEKH
jgi:hypothetical protein